MICKNIGINEDGHLTFAGQDVVELANEYGTALFLMDEERIRENCRTYMDAMKEAFGNDSMPLYAGKANCFKRMYEIMNEEGMAVDLVSAGEVHTAYKAGYDMANAYFHGNNKTAFDLEYAIETGVGNIVCDNMDEVKRLNDIAGKHGVVQNILLRLTPGIDPHTYEAVATGKVDSKFGSAIETGQAAEITAYAKSMPNLNLLGYHCHVGSQVFDEESSVYVEAAKIMIEFAAEMKAKNDVDCQVLNMGGGYGVRYVESDPEVNIPANIKQLADFAKAQFAEVGLPLPKVLLEPGRSISADAGMTVYSAGAIKDIPGYKSYVSVNGGMTDNPRFALYGSAYTVYLANRMNDEADFECDIVGCCCESGDIIQPKVKIPRPELDELIAVATTGAYCYSMSSNYNRVCKPPIVMLNKGESYVAVKRETLDDIIRNDV